ncbi:MAG: hypothetical protein HYV02_07120 [Deltaproteobacteria bacterium]|nr:hypothetical protein [Deltaproteobacteria bacterium]
MSRSRTLQYLCSMLLLIGAASCDEGAKSCAEGQTLVAGNCVAGGGALPEPGPGGDPLPPVEDPTTCPEGELLVNGVCAPGSDFCLEGQAFIAGACVCPDGMALEKSVCVKEEEKNGLVLVSEVRATVTALTALNPDKPMATARFYLYDDLGRATHEYSNNAISLQNTAYIAKFLKGSYTLYGGDVKKYAIQHYGTCDLSGTVQKTSLVTLNTLGQKSQVEVTDPATGTVSETILYTYPSAETEVETTQKNGVNISSFTRHLDAEGLVTKLERDNKADGTVEMTYNCAAEKMTTDGAKKIICKFNNEKLSDNYAFVYLPLDKALAHQVQFSSFCDKVIDTYLVK